MDAIRAMLRGQDAAPDKGAAEPDLVTVMLLHDKVSGKAWGLRVMGVHRGEGRARVFAEGAHRFLNAPVVCYPLDTWFSVGGRDPSCFEEAFRRLDEEAQKVKARAEQGRPRGLVTQAPPRSPR